MSPPFRVRGIVEGFYGPRWSHEARCHVISFVARRGMNAYMYAPKDDPFHRERWREPYPREEQAELARLSAFAREAGVRFGFAISPGLSIDYDSATDRRDLEAKLAPLLEVGVDWFVLALDDIPMAPGLAARQAALATWLHAALRDRVPDTALTLCPTEYVGTRPSPYLTDLAAGVPADVAFLWTGPTVCSPTITRGDAEAWAAAVAPHPVLLWDNYPVNDGTMNTRLHLGPYQGRDARLAEMVDGVLLNPMIQPRASLVALGTAARFLSDPDTYDAAEQRDAVVIDLAGDRAPSLRVIADACADGPLCSPAALALAGLVGTLDEEADGPGWVSAARAVSASLYETRAALGVWIAESDPLVDEVRPWAEAARREIQAGLAALRLIQGSRPVSLIDADGTGHAAAPDAEALLQAVFGLVFAWSGARANHEVTFGPRFAIYPAVVQTATGRPAVDTGMTLIEDANVIDWLCRVAFREYERWREEADETVRVMVDGTEREIAADGSFDARGEVAIVRSARLVTRVRPGDALPLRDRRFREQ